MPRPAVNWNFFRKLYSERYWRPTGSVPWAKWSDAGGDIQVRRLTRPASVSNPVRKNGTRMDRSYSTTSWYTSSENRAEYWDTVSASGQGYRYIGALTLRQDPLVSLTVAERLKNDVRNKALSNIGDNAMQFNAALLELKGTVRGVTNYYRHASHGLRRLFRDFPKKTQDRLQGTPPYRWKDVPGDYLGYLYGLAPIADDIANGARELSGQAKKEMAYGFTCKSGTFRIDEEELRVSPAGVDMNLFVKAKVKSWARCKFSFDFPLWWIEQVPIVTPFTTAYELTRLSFVLDWVAPFGDYIGAIEAGQFMPYLAGGFVTYGARRETVPGGRLIQRPATGRVYAAPAVSPLKHSSFRFLREVFYAKEGLKLMSTLRMPDFRNELGLGQFSQAAALAAQTFHKPPVDWHRQSNQEILDQQERWDNRRRR